MKPLLNLHARQTNQRRMSRFYLSHLDAAASNAQAEFERFSKHEDRPRTAREMFADDDEQENDDTEI